MRNSLLRRKRVRICPARQNTKTDTALISSGLSLPSKAGIVPRRPWLIDLDHGRAVGPKQIKLGLGQIGRSECGIARCIIAVAIEAVGPVQKQDAAALGLGAVRHLLAADLHHVFGDLVDLRVGQEALIAVGCSIVFVPVFREVGDHIGFQPRDFACSLRMP